MRIVELATILFIGSMEASSRKFSRRLIIRIPDRKIALISRRAGAPGIQSLCARARGVRRCSGREVRFEFECRDVRRHRRAGSGVGLERPARPEQGHRMCGVRFRPFINRFFNSSKRDSIMTAKRKIEVFSAGCPACVETIELVNRVACPSCEVSVPDMNRADVAQRAKGLGIRSVPAVVIDGKLADCCTGRGPQESTLRAAGLGQSA